MSSEEISVAVDIDDFDPAKMSISPVMTKSWSFKHKETGELCKGSYPFVLLCYGGPKQQFSCQIRDARTNNGITSAIKFQALFISANLTEEQSAKLRQVDKRVAELIFESRKEFLKGYANLSKVTKPSDVEFLMRPLVQDGQPKGDGSEDRYDDQITATVPSKKVNKQLTVDTNACLIEDIDGKPYAWASLKSDTLKEFAFQVMMIKYDEQIKYVMEARVIVPSEPAKQKVTTKRKLDMAKEEKPAKKSETKTDKPKPKVMQSRKKPAVSAYDSKLAKEDDAAHSEPETAENADE